MNRNVVAVLLAVVLTGCASQGAAPVRKVQGQTVRSSAQPRIAVRVAPELRYLGHVRQPAMGGKAEYEQFIFSETRGGKLGRTFIVHFEHILPGIDFTFDYPRLDMVTLGRHEYLHQTWPAEDPGLFKNDDVKALLAAKSLTLPSRWLVSRYVRTIGDDRRAELILFYFEPGGELPAAVPDLQLEGSRRELWVPIARPLAERARAVFTVED